MLQQRLNKSLQMFCHYPKLSATVLGGLFTLGFAPFHIWPLALLVMALLFFLVEKQGSAKPAATVTFVFALAHFFTGIHWVARSFYIDFGSWWVAAPLGVVAMLMLAAYMALFPTAAAYFYKKQKFQFPFVFAVLWCVFEFLRAQFPDIFPWLLVGYTWADTVPMMQLASLGEIWLMSLVFMLVAVHFAWIKRFKLGVFLASIMLLVSFSWGAYRVAGAGDLDLGLNVALVQSNIPQQEKWDRDLRRGHLMHLVELTNTTENVDLVVWPEMSILYNVVDDHAFRQGLFSSLALKEGASFVFGGLRIVKDQTLYEGYKAHNAAFLAENAEIQAEYHKQKLLPYGEYIPFRRYLPDFLKQFLGRRLDYVAGEDGRLMTLSNGKKALLLICGESAIPSLAKNDYLEADFIINITNDSWFDFTIGPYQHFDMSRIRAVSSGLPVLRSANTGRTAIIDSFGRVHKRLEMNHPSVLE